MEAGCGSNKTGSTGQFLAAEKYQHVVTIVLLLGGIDWGMSVQFTWDASKQGSTVGLCARAAALQAGAYCPCTYSLECIGAASARGSVDTFNSKSGVT
jgi:hypothetical protein